MCRSNTAAKRRSAAESASVLLLWTGTRMYWGQNVFIRRQHLIDKRCWFFIGTERPWHLVLDRWQCFQISRNGERILVGEMLERRDRHSRGQNSAVRPLACCDRGCNLLLCPFAKTSVVIGRKIGAVKHAEAWNFEANLGATQVALHVGVPEKSSWRVAIGAGNHADEVLTALDLRLSGARWFY
jgi:hypothetical protein